MNLNEINLASLMEPQPVRSMRCKKSTFLARNRPLRTSNVVLPTHWPTRKKRRRHFCILNNPASSAEGASTALQVPTG